MMRPAAVALVLGSLLLAGCTLPEEDKPDPLFGVCPQWEPGRGQVGGQVYLDPSAPQSSQVAMPEGGAYEMAGHPLDMVRLRIDNLTLVSGRVTVKLFAEAGNETMQRNWRDLRREDTAQVHELVLSDPSVVGQEFEAFLTSVDHDEKPRAGPVRLVWTLAGDQPADVTYSLTWHYKVCGIP